MATFEEPATIEVIQFSVESTSAIVKLILNGTPAVVEFCTAVVAALSSFLFILLIADIVGGSSIALTVKTKVLTSDKAPSDTVNVKFNTPLALSTGVTVAVQFGAVPLNTTLAAGTIVTSEVAALIELAQFSTLSISLMVKLIAKATSSFVT